MKDYPDSVDKFAELDLEVKDMLRRLEPEDVKTLRYLATIPKDELVLMIKAWRDFRANVKFVQKLVLLLIAIVVTCATFGENVMKILGWFKGGGGS